MNTFRTVLLAFIAFLAIACSSAPSTPTPPATPAVAAIAGNWNLTIKSSMGTAEASMTVMQNGTSINGTIDSTLGNVDYTGSVGVNDVKFGYSYNMQGINARFDFDGIVEANSINGKVVLGTFGEGQFTAKRK